MDKRRQRTSRSGPAKPREYRLGFTVSENTTVNGALVGRNGEIVPTKDGAPIPLATAFVEVTYHRPKGPKVLLRAPLDPKAPSIAPHYYLRDYNAILAVDTNTKQIGTDRVSVACVVQGEFVTDAKKGLLVTGRPLVAFELHNVDVAPERLAWQLTCQDLTRNPDVHAQTRIALIVDSELGLLQGFNSRAVPVLDGWHLPDSVTLIYASDAAAESIPNALIRECDAEATRVLANIVNGHGEGALLRGAPGAHYSHLRVWRWSESTDA